MKVAILGGGWVGSMANAILENLKSIQNYEHIVNRERDDLPPTDFGYTRCNYKPKNDFRCIPKKRRHSVTRGK